jgi:AcrR family transcriptional regulator
MDPAEVVRRPPFGHNPTVGERGTNTYRRILAAALDVFAEAGFHDASVELITEAAGCSRPAFYQYFPSKEDVFWRLAGQLAAEMSDLADALATIAPTKPGVERLREWFDSLIDLYAAYAPVFEAFPTAVREQQTPVAGESPAGISERIGSALLQSAGRGRSALAIDGLAGTTIMVLLRTINYWRAGVGDLSRPRFVDGTAQTLHRLLHGRVDGVNAGPVRNPPKKRAPGVPVSPSGEPARDRGRVPPELLPALREQGPPLPRARAADRGPDGRPDRQLPHGRGREGVASVDEDVVLVVRVERGRHQCVAGDRHARSRVGRVLGRGRARGLRPFAPRREPSRVR